MAFLAAIPAWVSAAVAVAGVAVTAYGQSQQMKASAKADQYNALVARQRSTATLSAANQREEQQRRYARVMAGERRTAISQSGTGLGGSNADVDRQSEIMAELDALNIRYEGQNESVGLLNQAGQYDYSAKSNKKAATTALWKGAFGAASSLLSSNVGGASRSTSGMVTIGGG